MIIDVLNIKVLKHSIEKKNLNVSVILFSDIPFLKHKFSPPPSFFVHICMCVCRCSLFVLDPPLKNAIDFYRLVPNHKILLSIHVTFIFSFGESSAVLNL